MPGNLVLRTRRERKNGRKHPRRTRNPAQSRKKIVFTIENSGELAKLFHAKRTLLNVSLAAMLRRKKKKEKEKKEEAKPPPIRRYTLSTYKRSYSYYFLLRILFPPALATAETLYIYIRISFCFLVQKSEKSKLA